jgi:hypothetical protein
MREVLVALLDAAIANYSNALKGCLNDVAALQVDGWLVAMSNTRSGTGKNSVTRKKLADARQIRNDLRNVEDHVARLRVLSNFAIDHACET